VSGGRSSCLSFASCCAADRGISARSGRAASAPPGGRQHSCVSHHLRHVYPGTPIRRPDHCQVLSCPGLRSGASAGVGRTLPCSCGALPAGLADRRLSVWIRKHCTDRLLQVWLCTSSVGTRVPEVHVSFRASLPSPRLTGRSRTFLVFKRRSSSGPQVSSCPTDLAAARILDVGGAVKCNPGQMFAYIEPSPHSMAAQSA